MEREIKLGNRKLSEITPKELLEVIVIEGSCADLEFWDKPEISDIDYTMFSDTIACTYTSKRKSDELESTKIRYYFNHKDFRYHYHKGDNRDYNVSNRFSIRTIQYLLKQGFYLPID